MTNDGESAGEQRGEAAGEQLDEQPAGPAEATSSTSPVAAELESLADLPLSEHPDLYQRIHEDLQGALADIDGA